VLLANNCRVILHSKKGRALEVLILDGKVDLPDVFILDQEIPIIDGFALSKFLRVKKETKEIPIIMLSAYPELREKSDTGGCQRFSI